MEVVRHHAKALQYLTRLFARFKQTRFERPVRPLVDKEVLPIIAPVDHMIHPTLALYP